MNKFTFQAADEYLNGLLTFGIKLGLENMRALNQVLGDPAKNLKFIHLAGTNGKGSTSAMIATACKASGLKTGFYSSPFLVNFLERWRVNGINIDEETYLRAIKQIIDLEDDVKAITGVRPTYFEVLTAAALLIFKDQQCDIVIWETGMGGRLDATNIVDPLITMITNISMDHSSYLGDTLLEIAGEKAGIIKDGRPFICTERKTEVREFLAEQAKDCTRYFIDSDFAVSAQENNYQYSGKETFNFQLSLKGQHQAINAGGAIKCLELLHEIGLINDLKKAAEAISYAFWPGRVQEIHKNLIIDGAHNPAAIKEIVKFLSGKKLRIICGMMEDKDIAKTLKYLAPICQDFIAIPINFPRAIKAEKLAQIAKSVLNCPCRYAYSWESELDDEIPTLIIGSLYLSGEVLAKLAPECAAQIDTLA